MTTLTAERKHKRPLPPGWRWVRLGEVADVVNGVGFPVHLQGRKDLPYLFVKVNDMNTPGAEETISATENTVDDALLRQLRGRVYPAGTIIFPKVGGALLTNKRRILGKPGCFDNNIMGLVPKDVNTAFLFYWFNTIDLGTFANVQALPSIRQSTVREFVLPLPPPDEQRAIVARLEAQMAEVQRLRQAAERQLEAARALVGALLRRVFRYKEGDPLPPGWRWVRLGEIFTLKYGDSLTEHARKGGSVPVFGSNGIVGYHSVAVTKGPAIVIGRKGSVGAVNFSEVGCWPIDTTYYVDETFFDIELQWLFWQLRFLDLPRLNKSAAIPGLNRDDVYALLIALPPPDEQRAIVARLEAQMAEVQRLRQAAERQLEAIRALPGALLGEVFGGYEPGLGPGD